MSTFTHLNEQGAAHMVDIAHKSTSKRIAIAKGILTISKHSYTLIRNQQVPKGDLFSTARIAGIMAAKSTAQMIPLCHPLPLTSIQVDFDIAPSQTEIIITAQVETIAQTGVEMEALTAVSVSALTLYDMLKAVDQKMAIHSIRLDHKSKEVIDYDTSHTQHTKTIVTSTNITRSYDMPPPLSIPTPKSTSSDKRSILGFQAIPKGVQTQSFSDLLHDDSEIERKSYDEVEDQHDSSWISLETTEELLNQLSIDEDAQMDKEDSNADVITSCNPPLIEQLPPPLFASVDILDDEDDELSQASWDDSILMDEDPQNIIETTPALSPAARGMIAQVKEVALDYEPLKAFLQQRPLECAYLLGYLTAEYTKRCRAFILEDEVGDQIHIRGLLFEYSGLTVPSVWTYGGAYEVEAIVNYASGKLARRLYMNMEDHHLQAIRTVYAIRNRKPTLRMGLQKSNYRALPDDEMVVNLSHRDTAEIMSLYTQYPDHLFEPAQLDTGLYCGIKTPEEKLISVAGIHLLNLEFSIAAIGNIVTDSQHRGAGHASRCVNRVLSGLFQSVENVALNVSEDNAPAIQCYRKFGFEMTSRIFEVQAKLR